MSAEQALALGVIERALLDSVLEDTDHEKRVAKREAKHFLTDRDGDWAMSRAYWCAAADIEEAALRFAYKTHQV